MEKKNEAFRNASRPSAINNVSQNTFLFNHSEQKKYFCSVFGWRTLSSSAPPYLTYTDKSPSTPEEIKQKVDKFRKNYSLDLYTHSLELFNKNKLLYRNLFLNGFIRLKVINRNNVILYSPPNRGGNVSGAGYELAKNNSNSVNARMSSKNNALQKALANVDIFSYFCTFTLDRTKQDRFDLKKSYHRLSHFLQARHIKYLIVPERHKDGAWHFHALCSADLRPYLADFEGKACQNRYIHGKLAKGEEIKHFADYTRTFGYNTVEPCRNKEACAWYMVKYVLKTFDDENYERVSRRRYFCSTGLHSSFVVHPSQVFRVNLNEFEPVRFSDLINKVTLKRYDPERSLLDHQTLLEHLEPLSCLKE